jgi:hypothetical protein
MSPQRMQQPQQLRSHVKSDWAVSTVRMYESSQLLAACLVPGMYTPWQAAAVCTRHTWHLPSHAHSANKCLSPFVWVRVVLQALAGSAGVPTVGNVLPQAAKVSCTADRQHPVWDWLS